MNKKQLFIFSALWAATTLPVLAIDHPGITTNKLRNEAFTLLQNAKPTLILMDAADQKGINIAVTNLVENFRIIARKHDGHWYIGGLNGTDHPMTLTVNLPMLAGKIVKYYVDKPRRIIKQEDKENVDSYTSELTSLKIDKSGNAKVTLQPLGGIIIVE